MHDNPVGPHPRGSCQLTIGKEQFTDVVSWLVLNRSGLTVFTHAQTGNALKDHTDHVIWLGPSETLKLSAVSADARVYDARLRNAAMVSAALARNLCRIERGELALAAEDTAVHHHGVDVAGLRQEHHRIVGIADRRHVEIGRADQDQIGALAGRQRADLVGNPEIARAVDGRKLDQPLGGDFDLALEPVEIHRIEQPHPDEQIAVVGGDVIDRERHLDA